MSIAGPSKADGLRMRLPKTQKSKEWILRRQFVRLSVLCIISSTQAVVSWKGLLSIDQSRKLPIMWTYLVNENQPRMFGIRTTINDSSDDSRAALSTGQPEVKLQVGKNVTNANVSSTLPEWKRRMIEKNEAAKREVIAIMDDSLRSVMAKAEKRPDAQRGKAVDSYVSAVDWIMWSVNSVINRVR